MRSVASLLFATLLLTPVIPAQMAPPLVKAHIYDDNADPRKDIAEALRQAKREHKRVLLDFGGDWCGDCQVLDIYFKREPNADLLAKHFVVVHIAVGHMDKNLDVAHRYGVPVTGVPALAVLDADGKVLVSQNKEFSNMRNMQSSAVTAFLTQWKG